MKKLFITLILLGITNVYAESGTYSSSAVCDYDKSAINTNNKIVGDIKKGTGGKGKTKIVGGTGKYAGITGECIYTVSYHTEDKMSSILDCSYTK